MQFLKRAETGASMGSRMEDSQYKVQSTNGIRSLIPRRLGTTLHSKKVFVTLTYSLSFEMRHNSRCSVHRNPTHTNGSKAIIIIDVAFYHAITVVIRGTIRYVVSFITDLLIHTIIATETPV